MRIDKPMRFLVIAPHHDDEVIGCGGTIASVIREGHQVDVLYLTAGDVGIPGVEQAEAIGIREKEAQNACTIMGVRKPIFLRHPDRDLEYSLKLVKEIVQILRGGQYNGLVFPHQEEKDRDHQIVSEVAGEASWIASSRYFPDLGDPVELNIILMYEVWAPMHVHNIQYDISNTFEIKRDALVQYESQFTSEQVNRLLGINTYRAAMHGESRIAVEVFRYYNH
jgi:N-acetylglucosamine malate deacetylase 1